MPIMWLSFVMLACLTAVLQGTPPAPSTGEPRMYSAAKGSRSIPDVGSSRIPQASSYAAEFGSYISRVTPANLSVTTATVPYIPAEATIMMSTTTKSDRQIEFQNPIHEARIYVAAPSSVYVTQVQAVMRMEPRTVLEYLLKADEEHDGDSGYFQIDPYVGNITTSRYIDKPAGSKYHLIVVASGGGVSNLKKLTITVTEYNRYGPVFEFPEYRIELDTMTEVGKPFIVLRAYDNDPQPYNAEVYFSIQKQNEVIAVNQFTGEVHLQRKLNTNILTVSTTLIAFDGGSPRRSSTAKLLINVKIVSAPENVEVVQTGHNWAMICWRTPKSGRPDGYIVYMNVTSNPTRRGQSGLSNQISSRNISLASIGRREDKLCTSLTDLLANSIIKIQMSGWNHIEIGKRSKPVIANTKVNRSCSSPDNSNFICNCLQGYYGEDCQFFNPCMASEVPCQNGGICSSNGSSIYECECLPGYYGKDCEGFNPCSRLPCQHGATCSNISNSSYKCDCTVGYTGSNCETNFDECSSSPCANGGTCIDGLGNFTCSCPSGITGNLCETDIDECTSNPCKNGATCHNELGAYSCQCLSGYTGPECELNVDECLSNPCENNGTCVDGLNDFTCNCEQGFEGDYCEDEIDECMYRPCVNGGTCQDAFNDFVCICPTGYYGKTCEFDMDLCESSPCQNGASCYDLVDHFHCNCSEGYHGKLCEQKVQCLHETVKTERGTYEWVSVDHGAIAKIPCPFGGQDNYTSRMQGSAQKTFFLADRFVNLITPQWTPKDPESLLSRSPTQRGQLKSKASSYFREIPHDHLLTQMRMNQVDKDGTAYAVRSCIRTVDGNVQWSTMLEDACRDEGHTIAERLSQHLEELTRVPSQIDSEIFINASATLNKIKFYALNDHKIARSMISVISNIMDVNDSIIEDADPYGHTSQSLVNIVDYYTHNVNLGTSNNISMKSQNLDLEVLLIGSEEANTSNGVSFTPVHQSKLNDSSETTHNEELEDERNLMKDVSISVPPEALLQDRSSQNIRVRFVSYTNSKFFLSSAPNNTIKRKPYEMHYRVISASVSNMTIENLTVPLVYSMSNIYGKTKQFCGYWDPKVLQWLDDGVTTNQTDTSIHCESTHLTAFSVLLDPDFAATISESDKQIMSIISYIGSALSVVGLLLTIMTYSLFRCLNRDRSGKILLNLCVSLLFMNVSFLLVSVKHLVYLVNVCVVVAVLTHYFVITSFTWMLVEAANMYHLLITVFATAETNFMLKRMIFAWGIPLVIVAATAASNIQAYQSVDSDYCLLSPTNTYTYYISYLAPCCTMLFINCVVFVLVTRVLFQKRSAGNIRSPNGGGVTLSQVRGAFTVMTLLGVTWVFGAIAIREAKVVFQYLFCILNSLQGFIIFLVRCVQYPEARTAWITLLRTGTLKKHRGTLPSSSVNNSQSRHTVTSSTHSQGNRKVSLDANSGSNNSNSTSIWSRLRSRGSQHKPRTHSHTEWSLRSVFGNSRRQSSYNEKNCLKTAETLTRDCTGKLLPDPLPISASLKLDLEKTVIERPVILRTQSMREKSGSFSNEMQDFKRVNSAKDNLKSISKPGQFHVPCSDSQESLSPKEGEDTSWQFLRAPHDAMTQSSKSLPPTKYITNFSQGSNFTESQGKSHTKHNPGIESSQVNMKLVSHSDQGYMSGACTAEQSPESPRQKIRQIPNFEASFGDINASQIALNPSLQINNEQKQHRGGNSEAHADRMNIEGNAVPLLSHTFVVINGKKIYTNNPSVRINQEEMLGNPLAKIDVQCMKQLSQQTADKSGSTGNEIMKPKLYESEPKEKLLISSSKSSSKSSSLEDNIESSSESSGSQGDDSCSLEAGDSPQYDQDVWDKYSGSKSQNGMKPIGCNKIV